MAVNQGDIITFENVQLFGRNFSGTKFDDGKRSFGFFLDPEQAEDMIRDGWNVKYTKPPKNGNVPDDWEPRPWLKVALGFKYRPPKILQITSRGRTVLDEEAVDTLDWASIQEVDLSIRARFWEVNGNTGLMAYLYELYVTLEESPLALKYAQLDEVVPYDYEDSDDPDME